MTFHLTLRTLTATPVHAPLAVPIRTASGTVDSAPLVLIDLTTEEGITGSAYVFTFTPLALGSTVEQLKSISPLLNGMSAAPYDIAEKLEARFRLLGKSGVVGMALAGIDMAVWDLLSKSSGLPLARFLGGDIKPIQAYASLGMDGVEGSVRRVEEAMERGFKGFKIKVGYPTISEDLEVIRQVKNSIGSDGHLMVDYNQSLSIPEAVRRCRILENENLTWIEEPTRQEDYSGHRWITGKFNTPIQMGENWFGTDEMFKGLVAGSSDLVMPDLMKIGGITGWLRAASLAEAYKIPMSNHLFHEISAHLLSVTPTAHWLEHLELAEPILQKPLMIKDGFAIASDDPGTGLMWDQEAVKRFKV